MTEQFHSKPRPILGMVCSGSFLVLISLWSPAFLQADPSDLLQPTALEEADSEAEAARNSQQQQGELGEREVLLNSLDGIVIASDESTGLQLQGQSGGAGVNVSGFDPATASSLTEMANSQVGKKVSLHSLDRFSEQLKDWFGRHQDRVVDAWFPEQEITSGVVVVVVQEKKLGEVRVEGLEKFGAGFIQKNFRTFSGGQLSASQIYSDLEWINRNPFRQVNLEYVDGESGLTDLVLQMTERRPIRGYVGYDNYSHQLLGDDRLFAGFQLGNVWGLDHRFLYQYTTDLDFEKLQAHSLQYEAPLPWRHELELGFTNSETDAVLSPTAQLSGTSTEVSMLYRIPLPTRSSKVSHEFHVGGYFRESTYNISQAGVVNARSAKALPVQVGYELRFSDSFGFTEFHADAFFNLPNAVGMTDADYAVVKTGAEADFSRFVFNLERTTFLPREFSLYNEIEAQWTEDVLLPSEQFSATGAFGVRGYDENRGFSDRGIRVTTELQSPGVSLFPNVIGNNNVRLVGFFDHAWLQNVGAPTQEISGAGFGARWNLRQNLRLKADIAFPTTRAFTTDDPHLHLSAALTF